MESISKELRQAVLQAAIQGKLTKQLPEDGNARDLLNQIKTEKEWMIKEKKIKKEKALAPITDDEIPFDIPDNWVWCRLGDIGVWGSGATPSTGNINYYRDGTIPWLITGDLNDGFIDDVPGRITDLALRETSVKLNKIGSVLIAMYGATTGKLGILNIEATTNQACCACQTFFGVFNLFLFYYLMFYKPYFISKAKGGAQPNISREKIVKSLIPLPPLLEQHRIVARVKELMVKIDELEKVENELRALHKAFPDDMKSALLQSAMQGKLTEQLPEDGNAKDLLVQIKAEKERLIKEKKIKKEKALEPISEDEVPFDIPDNWEWCRFGFIVNYNMGKTPPRKEEEWWGNDFPWVSISDMVKNGHVSTVKEKVSNKSIGTIFKNISKVGTMLMSFKLTVGRVSILDIDAVHNEAIISIYPYVNSENIMRDYLFKVLPFVTQWGDSKNAIKGKTLNDTSISNLMIPLPPLGEQKRIVEKLDKLLPLCDSLQTEL